MSYTRAPRSFGIGATLGAVRGPLPPPYYARPAELHWSSSAIKKLHDSLVGIDVGWQNIVKSIGQFAGQLSFAGVGKDLQSALLVLASSPTPIAADCAVILEIVGGSRPLDSTTTGVLLMLEEREAAVAAAFTAVASVAGIVCAVSGGATAAEVAGVVSAPAGIATAPPAVIAGAVAALATTSAALWAALAALTDGLLHGSLSEKDYRTLVRACAVASGKDVSDKDIDASADWFYSAQEELLHKRADAVTKAKAKSAAKLRACSDRGGHYDPQKGACVVPPRGVTKLEQQAEIARQQGEEQAIAHGAARPGSVWWWILGVGAAAGAGIVIWRSL